MNSALTSFHKCFTLTVHLKSAKCECLWSRAEHMAEAVTCRGNYILHKAKMVKSLHHYVL